MVALLVSVAVGVMTMRSCQPAGNSSPASPSNLARVGVAGICADRQAVADADAGETADPMPAVTLPPNLAASLAKSDPGAAALLAQGATCQSQPSAP